MGIDEELKLFEKAEGSLQGYAMESAALYAIVNAHEMSEDKCGKILSFLQDLGRRVVAEGYMKSEYETAIDDEIDRHDQNSLLKYGFTGSDVIDAMGNIWAEENEME